MDDQRLQTKDVRCEDQIMQYEGREQWLMFKLEKAVVESDVQCAPRGEWASSLTQRLFGDLFFLHGGLCLCVCVCLCLCLCL